MPSGDFRLMEMDFLLRDCKYHQREVPSCSLRHFRMGSPSTGASILMTSAPNSAIIRAANGAAIKVPISMTQIPLRGPLITVSFYRFFQDREKLELTSNRKFASSVRQFRTLASDKGRRS